MVESKHIIHNGDIIIDDQPNESLHWEDFFMCVALLSAERSKDPCTQLGACIIDKTRRLVAIGYNGMPFGCDDDKFPWGKHNEDPLKNKSSFVCHAEANAILNKNSHNVKNCTMYVKLFPCNECAKLIIQAGIKEIIYLTDHLPHKTNSAASRMMFDAAKIKYRQHIPKQKTVTIDFTQFD